MTRSHLFFLVIFAFLILCITPFLGSSIILPEDVINSTAPYAKIFWKFRIPRTVAAFLVGSGLALCGLVFQTMFQNPLTTPYTLGVSSGAAFGASIYFYLGSNILGFYGFIVSALLGSFLSIALVFIVTFAKGGFSPAVMLLAGVIISFFFSSLIMFVQYLGSGQDASLILRWLMGSLSVIAPGHLMWLAAVNIFFASIVFLCTQELDLIAAGDEFAKSKGVNVSGIRLILFTAASVETGVIVSITGPIGFVGMIIPQICRLQFGLAHKNLVLSSLILGGSFLAVCDLAARTILAPAELPVGIITAMLGSPFFLWMLLGRKNDFL